METSTSDYSWRAGQLSPSGVGVDESGRLPATAIGTSRGHRFDASVRAVYRERKLDRQNRRDGTILKI